MGTSKIVATAMLAALALAGCSSDPKDEKPEAVSTPRGFDVPSGVTLTKGGTTLKVGRPASVVYQVGGTAASAITVTVTKVLAASIEDFRFFSLDAAAKKSRPYYVSVSVMNDGPAGLGGAALPMVARDSIDTRLPASDIVGAFKPCPVSTLPASFLPGAVADLCLIYLVPEGRKLKLVDLQTGSAADVVSWKP